MSVSRAERRRWVEELAAEVGRLRRRSDLGAAVHRVDLIASIVERLWIDVTPTAAELVREGLDVEDALDEAEREKQRQHRILAADTVEKRRLERLRESSRAGTPEPELREPTGEHSLRGAPEPVLEPALGGGE